MDEKRHVTPIIKNQFRSVTLTIIFWLYKDIQDSVTVLIETLTLIGKHSSRLVMRNDSHSVILSRENVSRSPT